VIDETAELGNIESRARLMKTRNFFEIRSSAVTRAGELMIEILKLTERELSI
jgi:hypothetical protein